MAERHPRYCGAKNRQGNPCHRPAGWGTDHVGDGRCKLHGGNAGAPPGEENGAFRHGLRAKYVKVDDLGEVYGDPQKRMSVLAGLMMDRAIAAHRVTMEDPDEDTEATAKRIVAAGRVAIQATKVQFAVQQAQDPDEDGTATPVKVELVVTDARKRKDD